MMMNDTSVSANTASSSSIIIPPTDDDCRTTVFLIVLIHVLFLHQWNSRQRRKDLLVSYHVIVQKRQFHKLWMALLSHPPAAGNHTSVFRQQQQQSDEPLNPTAVPLGNNNTTTTANTAALLMPHQELRAWLTSLIRQVASWSYQSGFALLLYNSHILWSCRALEGFYNWGQFLPSSASDATTTTTIPLQSPETTIPVVPLEEKPQPLQYARVLLTLAAISVLVELRICHTLLKISKRLAGQDVFQQHLQPSMHDNNRMQQKILRRPIGTLTALSCALITLFQHHFPYVPLQVLPFVDNRVWLLGFNLLSSSTLSSLACWAILGYLSYPSHPITPVMCGLLSGILWAFGITSFLQDAYWAGSMVLLLLVLCCLSLRASDNHTSSSHHHETTTTVMTMDTWIPCVDYVSWNHRGQSLVRPILQLTSSNNNSNNTNNNNHTSIIINSSDDEDDDDDSSTGTSSGTSSIYSSSPRPEQQQPPPQSRLRDPNVNDDDDDSDSMEAIPLLMDPTQSQQQQTMRSRRGISS